MADKTKVTGAVEFAREADKVTLFYGLYCKQCRYSVLLLKDFDDAVERLTTHQKSSDHEMELHLDLTASKVIAQS